MKLSQSNMAQEGKVIFPAQKDAAGGKSSVYPLWVTNDLIAYTIDTWQPYYKERLTERDSLDIILAVGRYFEAIKEG